MSGAPSGGDTGSPDVIAGAFDRLRGFWPGFELRVPQIDMAIAVHETLRHGGRLAVEAPTGVGKSIAYLIPAFILARDQRLRVMISTNTKNLQQQIISRDAPRIRDVLAPELSLALLKGRSNYLCQRLWQTHLQRELLPGARADFLDRLARWVDTTRSGDLEEFGARNAQEWEWLRALAAPEELEMSALCARAPQCFVRDSRRRAAQANVVVVNHALLLTHHLTPAQVLTDYDVLIVDEAHTLPAVATRILERRVSPSRLRTMLARLTGGADLRLLDRVKRLLESGPAAVSDAGTSPLIRVADHVTRARRLGDAFFRDTSRRVRSERRRYRRRDAESGLFSESLDPFLDALRALIDDSTRIVHMLEHVDLGSELDEETALGFGGAVTQAAEFLESLRFTVELPDEHFVYWYEEDREPTLMGVPLHPGEAVARQLLLPSERLIMTSATLAAGDSFTHFLGELGLGPDDADTFIAGSAFDLPEQVLALAPPMPRPTDQGFATAVADAVVELARGVDRKALVLFTSHALLREVHERVRDAFAGESIAVLGQGIDGQREWVTRSFRSADRALLLGTASFWEGVDFPGEELELLVLARLPFPVPNEPVVEARCEEIDAEGGSSFARYMVPEAVLRFRQGFGRLIRRATDRGVFVILDPRIRSAGYRKRFLEALPVPVAVTEDLAATTELAREWFARAARPDPGAGKRV